MNKYITTDVGGLPIVLDDFRFIDDSVRNAFNGFSGAFGKDTEDGYLLQGATVAPDFPNFDVRAGYIVFGGEIFQVLAATVPAPSVGQELVWAIDSTFDPAGNKTFDSGGTFDTYEIRRAHVVSAVVVASSLLAEGTPTIHEKIAILAGAHLGDFTEIDLFGSASVVQLDAGLAEIAPTQAPGTGSFLRYNIQGKKITCTFKINDIILKTFGVSNCVAIRINSLPFTFNSDHIQTATCKVVSPSHADVLQGIHVVETEAGTNNLRFRLLTNSGSFATWNRGYEFAAIPSKTLTVTASTTFSPTFDVDGSFAFEID